MEKLGLFQKRWDSFTSTTMAVDEKKKRDIKEQKALFYDLPQTFLDNIE